MPLSHTRRVTQQLYDGIYSKKRIIFIECKIMQNYPQLLSEATQSYNKCDRVCIKGPLLRRYETEISAVKVNWSILVGFREIHQSSSLLHKEAVDSYFKLISKLEVAEVSIFPSK